MHPQPWHVSQLPAALCASLAIPSPCWAQGSAAPEAGPAPRPTAPSPPAEVAGTGARPAASVREAPVLQPTLLGELDYRVYPSESEGNTGFALGRLRPGLVLSPAPWLRAVAAFESAGTAPIILDAYTRLRAADWVELTVGYSKPPLFASFAYEPVHTMPFPDRAPVITSFRIRRDLGVDVHLSPRTVPLEAWLRVGNGTGTALGNDNALPAGYAALDLVLGRAWAGASPERRTFGLRVGGAALVESARERDGIVGQTPLGFVYYRPTRVSGLRIVAEGHVIAYAGPVRLTVEGALASEERSRGSDGNPSTQHLALPTVRSYGLTAELAWVLLGCRREVGRAPRGEPGPVGVWRGGALEIAARYDGMWLGEGASDVRSGGSQGGALALKWWPVAYATVAVAGYVTHFNTAPVEEPDHSWSWGAIARLGFFWGLPGQPQAPTTPEPSR